MAGVDSAGLGEVLQNVLARFSDGDKGRLVQVRQSIRGFGSTTQPNGTECLCHGCTVATARPCS
jgi:hypothetical protein